jgi:hypothetical protein
MEDTKVEIDESLYSRQQIMLGSEAMKKMAVSNVFISGFGGVGLEAGKRKTYSTTRLYWRFLRSILENLRQSLTLRHLQRPSLLQTCWRFRLFLCIEELFLNDFGD